jgi:hypothetical protein
MPWQYDENGIWTLDSLVKKRVGLECEGLYGHSRPRLNFPIEELQSHLRDRGIPEDILSRMR